MINNRHVNDLILYDRVTKTIKAPNLLLTSRTGRIYGKISRYENWSCSLVGNGLDEISFDVCKTVDGQINPIWEEIIDLRIIRLNNFENFEIDVSYADADRTIKTVHGVSLEAELGQYNIDELHINDDEDLDFIYKEGEPTTFKEETVFYDESKPEYSLMHRVLKDKAPHWKIVGNIYDEHYLCPIEGQPAELENKIIREFTVSDKSIYDFLVDEVAPELNILFVFDSIHREIGWASLSDGYDENGDLVCHEIGKDTTILIDKKNLAEDISIQSNKDSIKNSFRVEGGDDVINDMVRTVNINGSNYIYQFAKFQYDDMPEELVDKLKEYQNLVESTRPRYEEEFDKLIKLYDDLAGKEHLMVPESAHKSPEFETAEQQWEALKEQMDWIKSNKTFVCGVKNLNYTPDAHVGVDNNIEAMANILIDSRYDLSIDKNTISYDNVNHMWRGVIILTRDSEATNTYPIRQENYKDSDYFNIKISDDKNNDSLPFTRQKVEKALYKGDMSNIDYDVTVMSDEEMEKYFDNYSLKMLETIVTGYAGCVATIDSLYDESDVRKNIREVYRKRENIANKVYEKRKEEVKNINDAIKVQESVQQTIQKELNFADFLGEDLFKIYCSYRRDDTYQNSNYISDAQEDTNKLMKKAEELVQRATKEINKACVLQRTLSCSLQNLFAMPEFEILHDSFQLYNYIRIKTEDELIKLRLIGVDYSGDDPAHINVTFSENIESIDGNVSDLQSILNQASTIATSYNATIQQAQQGSYASNNFYKLYSEGLNTTNMMLKNSTDNEIVIDQAGILVRRMGDEGDYGQNQLRIIGNGIYMTDDKWATLSMAIGEHYYNGDWRYGVIAPRIVGQLIAGERMEIGNEKGSVSITGDGINITNGTITWGKNAVNSPTGNDITVDGDKTLNESLKSNDDFKKSVSGALSGGNESTVISKDSIITPKIGGGYLYLTNGSNTSVEIDPSGKRFDGNTTIFQIIKDGKPVLGFNDKGDMTITGKITATSGTIGGSKDSNKLWQIGDSSIYNGCSSITDPNVGTYVGIDGFRNVNNNKTYSTTITNGTLTTNNINATGGSFTGAITGSTISAISFKAQTGWSSLEMSGSGIELYKLDENKLNSFIMYPYDKTKYTGELSHSDTQMSLSFNKIDKYDGTFSIVHTVGSVTFDNSYTIINKYNENNRTKAASSIQLNSNGTIDIVGSITSNNSITATSFIGNVTGSSSSCTGNAATASVAESANSVKLYYQNRIRPAVGTSNTNGEKVAEVICEKEGDKYYLTVYGEFGTTGAFTKKRILLS